MRRLLSRLGLFALPWFAACTTGNIEGENAAGKPSELPTCPEPPARAPLNDTLSYTRLLRRVALTLTGSVPSTDDYEAVVAAGSDEAKQAILDKAIDKALASPEFYDRMMAFGHDWITVGEYTTGAQGESYQGNMSGDLGVCGDMTKHPKAYYSVSELAEGGAVANVCNDLDLAGAPRVMEVNDVEPWWAPGTTVTVIGKAGLDLRTIEVDGKTVDCGVSRPGYYDPFLNPQCGCGPNLVYCAPFTGFGGSDSRSEVTQRRKAWEEPARLLAHLAWHDRPLTDLVLGNYSVADNMLRALYVRMGRNAGIKTTDDTKWWLAASDSSPRDPNHPTAGDPYAWREFVVETLQPQLLSLAGTTPSGSLERTYSFDPTKTKDAPTGIPAAGVLTMMGSMSSFARERPRAARFLEMFACHNFLPPPADQKFNAYNGDPATSGPCQNCHRALDPAAIAFKRWDFGHAGYVPIPFIPGLDPYRVTHEQLGGKWPYSSSPYTRWKESWTAGTVLTPLTKEQLADNAEAIFLDTIPADQTLLGQKNDGTMGPLAVGKILVRSGEFDRCATQKIYERIVGRPLDPSTESGYLRTLTEKLVSGGRTLRPFIKHLLSRPEFRRGL